MTSTALKCPKCGGTDILTERRPDGNRRCGECGYQAPTATWLPVPFTVVNDRDVLDESGPLPGCHNCRPLAMAMAKSAPKLTPIECVPCLTHWEYRGLNRAGQREWHTTDLRQNRDTIEIPAPEPTWQQREREWERLKQDLAELLAKMTRAHNLLVLDLKTELERGDGLQRELAASLKAERSHDASRQTLELSVTIDVGALAYAPSPRKMLGEIFGRWANELEARPRAFPPRKDFPQ